MFPVDLNGSHVTVVVLPPGTLAGCQLDSMVAPKDAHSADPRHRLAGTRAVGAAEEGVDVEVCVGDEAEGGVGAPREVEMASIRS